MDLQNRVSATLLMRLPGALFFVAMILAGCSSGSGSPEPGARLSVVDACFSTGDKTVGVQLELARTPQDRKQGLMARETLAPKAGMLFQYNKQQSPQRGFWMFQTIIPLDIAYLDAGGVIRSIQQMTPCTASDPSMCPAYPAGVAFTSAVEMNAGFFHTHNLHTGARLELEEKNCKAP